MNIYGYTRESTAGQEMSGHVQTDKINAYCAYKWGRPADTIFSDPATHGFTLFGQRPGGMRLLLQAEAGDHVVMAKVDRGFRKLADLCNNLDLFQARHVNLHLLDINVDTSSDVGRAMVHMMGVFAELERSRISERTKESMRHRKAAGKPVGKAPYGFRNNGKTKARCFVPWPEEREFGRLCLEWKDNGYTKEEIAIHLRRAGLRHPRHKGEIHPSSVWRWMLKELEYQAREAAGQHVLTGQPVTV